MGYGLFLREHVVKGEWRFERSHEHLEGKLFTRGFSFIFVLIVTSILESFMPSNFFWSIILPMYVNWFTYRGWDFIKPWKSPILAAIMIVLPLKSIHLTV